MRGAEKSPLCPPAPRREIPPQMTPPASPEGVDTPPRRPEGDSPAGARDSPRALFGLSLELPSYSVTVQASPELCALLATLIRRRAASNPEAAA
jgi:hypothetical protein